MSRIKYVKRDTINSIKGDTTFYSSHFKGTQSDKAIMYIDTHQKNLYRHIIDNTQYRKITNPLIKIKTDVCDWTFSDKRRPGARSYRSERYGTTTIHHCLARAQ